MILANVSGLSYINPNSGLWRFPLWSIHERPSRALDPKFKRPTVRIFQRFDQTGGFLQVIEIKAERHGVICYLEDPSDTL
jgi:hypothetical protein